MCSLRATAVIHKLNQKTKSLVSISLCVVWIFKMGSSCIYVYHYYTPPPTCVPTQSYSRWGPLWPAGVCFRGPESMRKYVSV